ncbi:hypothetical protein [Lactococcus lactis]|uniref:hypothetical protein n=1 Tax=Lactococcus lactis TaxID=1358 RepID=UPI000E6B6B37|nr:hypothetical protein [Lactococcus lactis]RJK92253.1 hypothetical protein D4M07_01420 [Lactococcus lactis subsp. lactis]
MEKEEVMAIGFKVSGTRIINNELENVPKGSTVYVKRIDENDDLIFTIDPNKALKLSADVPEVLDGAKKYARENELELAWFGLQAISEK